MTFVKGTSGNPAGKPLGAKNKATLLKEERRALFEARISQRWEEIIDQLPPTYIADQYLGKAPDKLEMDAKIETNDGLTQELIDEAKRLLKEKLTKPNA